MHWDIVHNPQKYPEMVCVCVYVCGGGYEWVFFKGKAETMDKGESTKSRGSYQERENGSGDSLGDKSVAHTKNEAVPKSLLAFTV